MTKIHTNPNCEDMCAVYWLGKRKVVITAHRQDWVRVDLPNGLELVISETGEFYLQERDKADRVIAYGQPDGAFGVNYSWPGLKLDGVVPEVDYSFRSRLSNQKDSELWLSEAFMPTTR